jgi:hypothetical protein
MHFTMNKLYILFALVLSFSFRPALAQDTDTKNKTLFDQTVDKVNFRTIEFVYDRKFPRKKFPAAHNDFKARKTFDDFEGNAAFKKLFMNYNDVSEKFKKKFGNGRNDLASFEKGLGDILINKDFEFFISSLNKDDKIQLIKSLQQINKKGIAQFVDASGKPRGFFSSDSVIDESEDPIAKPGQPKTQPATVEAGADSNQVMINTEASPEDVFAEKTPQRDWLTWISLLLSLGALGLAASLKFKDVPGLRSFMANNYQKRSEGGIAVIKPQTKAETTATPDPAVAKQLGNLTREVEGLYAQMDELLHKNAVLEQKLAGSHPKPFDLPKTAYFEPETEPNRPAETVVKTPEKPEVKPVQPETTKPAEELSKPQPMAFAQPETKTTESSATFTGTGNLISENETEEQTPESTFYLGKPEQQGFFWNDDLRRSFIPTQSFYELTFSDSNSRKATFRFVTDPAQQKLALENPELYLYPVCDLQGEGTKIETETPGVLVFNADQWVLVKKASLRVVS